MKSPKEYYLEEENSRLKNRVDYLEKLHYSHKDLYKGYFGVDNDPKVISLPNDDVIQLHNVGYVKATEDRTGYHIIGKVGNLQYTYFLSIDHLLRYNDPLPVLQYLLTEIFRELANKYKTTER